MQEQIISFDTAKLTREKKFDWACTDGYGAKGTEYFLKDYKEGDILFDNWNYAGNIYVDSVCCISAPTQSLLQKWLREKHNIDIIVKPWTGDIKGSKTYASDVYIFGTTTYIKNTRVNSYEEALEEGLLEALKLIK